MPAHAKLATALALSLALAGAGTAIAQSSSAVADHATYVTMVNVQGTAGPEEMTGTVSCDVPLHERVLRRTMGKQACLTDDYAYAYPSDKPAPWTSQIEDVDQSMYVDTAGSVWHVAEVSYQTIASAPEGGPELVTAMASEILPADGGGEDEELSYAMPVDEELLEQSEEELIVDVGPAPEDASQRAPGAS